MAARWPERVRVVEVGPRDGLQNEAGEVPTEAKIRFISLLAATGLRDIEATSFVSPRAMPRLADASAVFSALPATPGPRYSALVPNLKGLERALAVGVRHIAVFTGATDSFTRHNIGMTVEESLGGFAAVIERARAQGVSVRGYISVCFGCPYEGAVAPTSVHAVARRLLDLGCDELSLGDTIGVAVPTQIDPVVSPALIMAGAERVALHFHDTYGAALANVLAAMELGVTTFDASAGGLGGCPYAPGASGNLATEDLLHLLHGMGVETGVTLEGVAAASRYILGVLGRPSASKVLQALQRKGEDDR
ncbi:MAG: hydroxymethylglutaryl-CoA lyase [Chloroflexota bacterium]